MRKEICVVMDVNQTYCDPSTMYTNIKPLRYLPETNITLYFDSICTHKGMGKNLEGHTA